MSVHLFPPEPPMLVKYSGQSMADTRNIAAASAHQHANITRAVALALREYPGLGHLDIIESRYTGKNGRRHRMYYLSRRGFAATAKRLHTVAGVNMHDLRRRYEDLFERAALVYPPEPGRFARFRGRAVAALAEQAPEPVPEPIPEPVPEAVPEPEPSEPEPAPPEPEEPVPPIPEPVPEPAAPPPLSMTTLEILVGVALANCATCLRLILRGPQWDRRAEAIEKWAGELRQPAPAREERH